MKVTPTGATLGAVITGIDLASLSESAWRALEDAFHEHAVLIFPAQHLSAAAQVAFGVRFGRVEQLVPGMEIVPISNQRKDGSLLADGEHQMQVLIGNEGWHTDSSYMPIAAKASILSAHVLPSTGGETEWADMRAAYQALDDAMRARIEGLAAYHSLFHSQAKIGHQAKAGAGYGFHEGEPPLRPLVKTHPMTGQPALYVGRHAYGIPGLSEQASEQLLADLVSFACQPPRTLQHRWSVGDLVIWDNRCVLHRARPYDHRQARVMQHTRIQGEPDTESGLAA
ncbi:MAG: TauD/TfdA family dioxygenase [Gammaproteobacteria bacterium]|nr:TauD/TfdA family dioxygenase [Gammaproteobacteria bacterium]